MHRRLVTFAGAQLNYGVVVAPDFSVDEPATEALRRQMSTQRDAAGRQADKLTNGQAQGGSAVGYDRGGTMSELIQRCREETGLEPPTPQWERDPYGPHTGLPYVKDWYRRMREQGMGGWDRI